MIIEIECFGECEGEGCLTDAGHILQQDMSLCKHCEKDFENDHIFSDNDALHRMQNLMCKGRGFLCGKCGSLFHV